MIVRWTAGALAELESIHAYQQLHWPMTLAAFEARLTEIERRIADYPESAPGVAQRPGVRVVAFRNFPYRLFYSVEGTAAVLSIRHTSRRPPFE